MINYSETKLKKHYIEKRVHLCCWVAVNKETKNFCVGITHKKVCSENVERLTAWMGLNLNENLGISHDI